MRTFTQKWAFLLMVVLFGCCLQVNAQSDLTVADGTSTSTYLPLYGLNADTQGMKGQCLYPADSLTDMVGGSISQITFYCGSTVPTEVWGGTFIVYLGETDESNLSSAFISTDDLTAVYTGTLDATSGTLTIEFDDAYTYQGGNLVVDVTLSVTGNWKSASFLGVNNLTGSGRYRTSGSGAGTATAFLPKAEFVYTPGGSVGPTCDKPTDLDFTGVSAHDATLNWAGGSGTYDVEYQVDGAGKDNWMFVLKNTTQTSATLSNLIPNKKYNVRVKSKCDGGVESGYKTGSFTTKIGIPYSENFDASTSIPSDWKQYTGLLNDVLGGTAALTSTTSGWSINSTSCGDFTSRHLYQNIYGSSKKSWITLPVIPMEENTELVFNLAVTRSSCAEKTRGAQNDDKFAVLISTDSMVTWTVLRLWDNVGSEYVFDDISNTGEEIEIDLSAYYQGDAIIAFYAESTSGPSTGAGDNYFHIDNVLVHYLPSCLKPTRLHEVEGGVSKNAIQVAWEHDGAQLFKVQYKKVEEDTWSTIDVTDTTATLTSLDEFTEYNIRVAAFCDPTDSTTLTDYCKQITVKTATGVPFLQNFNIAQLPSEWKLYDAKWELVQSGAVLKSTNEGWKTVAKAQANNVFDSAYHAVLNIADTMNFWLVSPTIEMEPGQQLTFDLALTKKDGSSVAQGGQPDDIFGVLVFVDGAWEELNIWANEGTASVFDQISGSTSGQTIKFDMDPFAGKSIRLAFYGESSVANGDNNLHLANLKIDVKPACAPALSLSIEDLDVTTATAVWTTDEPGGVWQYALIANPASDFEPVDSLFINDTTALSVALTGLVAEMNYAFILRHACDNGYSEPIVRTFKTLPVPKSVPWIEDFELYTANAFVPYWDVSASSSYEATTTKYYIWGVYSYSSNKMIRMYNSMVKAGTAIINTPRINLAPENGCMLSFDYTHAASCDPFSVRISTDNGKNWTELASYANNASNNSTNPGTFTRAEINLADYAGQVVMLQFYAVANYGSGAIFVDNIKIEQLPDCLKPTNLAVSNINAHGATFSWDNEEGAAWEYVCVPDSITELPAYTACAQNSIQLDNLNEMTDYIFYLRRVCGENSVSDSIFVTFSTPCAAYSIANNGGLYLEGFEDYEGTTYSAAGVVPDCWTVGGTASVKPHVIGSGSYYYTHSGTKALTFYGSGYCYAALPQFEEELNTLQIKFWMQVENASNGSLTLGYITDQDPGDFSTFTPIQSFPNSSGVMTKYDKILDEIDAEAHRLAFRWYYSSQYSCCIDDIEVSPIPTCLKPTDLTVVDSLATTTSVTIKWEPALDEQYYLVQYKKSTDSIWSYVADTVHLADTTFTITGLEPSSVYDIQFASWCNTIDSTDISEFTNPITAITSCDVITSFPWSEDFDGIDAGTSGSTNLLPLCWDHINTTTYSSYMGYPIVYKGATYANTPNNSLKFYSYSASSSSTTNYDPQDQYAILPEMEGLNTLRIKFNARKYSASYDATFTVGVMTDPADVATYVVVDTISPTSATYESFVVPFNSDTTGARYIAIKMDGVTVASTAAYRGVHIDDIVVEAIPNCLEPNNLTVIDSLITMNSAVLTWNVQGDETEWILQYKKHADEEWISVPATNDTTLLENLESATMYDARVAAKCDEANVSPFTAQISFVTACGAYSIAENGAFTEGFEAYEGAAYNATTGIIPNCWEALSSGTVAPHVIKPSDTYAYIHGGEKALTFYGSGYCYAVLPEFAEPLNTLQISFWAAMESASNGTLTLGYITNESDYFYPIASYDSEEAKVMAPYETVLSALPDSAARLVFQWYYSSQWSCCIDDIKVSFIPNCLKPTDLEAKLTRADGSVATLNWKAGKDENAWAVEYSLNEDFSDSVYVEVNDSTLAITGLLSDSTYFARVKAICGETEESEWSNPISFTPTDAIIVNDSTNTNSYVPFYGYYVNYDVKSQFIVPASEMNIIAWDSITQLTFYSSTATAALTGAEFDVYMAPIDTTVIASEMDWNAMTKVVSKKHLSVADKQMVVALDKPYQYEGGNLLIGFKLATKASSYGTTASFYGKSNQTGASIGGYASSSTGTVSMTQRNFLPKMRIDHVHGEMPTCFKVKDIAVSNLTASSATLSWTKGTEDQAAWQIAISTEADFNPNTAALLEASANTYALANLATETTYYVYVRANCSDGDNQDFSVWSDLFSFQTASACQTPDDLKASEISTTSASISWNTYGQTGFNLLYTDGSTSDTIYNVETSPYLIEGLLSNKSYSVKVQPACAAANDWSQALVFKTAYGIPFSEKFGTTTLPTDWSIYSGLMNDVLDGTATRTEVTSIWNFGTGSNGVFDSHAYINIYGTSRYHWLETPAIHVVGDVQLTFDLALTKYSGTLAPVVDTLQQDDKFVVLISEDNGDSWTILREWNNSGSEYVYNNIACSAEGEPVAISLAAYSGKGIKIAFYGESTISGNGDNNLHIDNVLIDLVPTCIKPQKLTVSDVKAHTAKVAWTAEEGQTAWQIACTTKATAKPDTLTNIINVTENPYVLEGLDPTTTYYIYVRANCGEQDGYSKWTDAKSFTTTVACPAPKNLQAVLTPGDGTIASLKWTAGGDEQSWRVEYSTNANMSDSVAVVVDDTIYNITGLTAETTYYARVLADCGELDSLSAYSAVISFTPTNKFELGVNDGSATNTYVPVEGNYVDAGNTVSQFIIPAASLEAIEWDSIKALTFHSSTSTSNWGASQWEIYMTETPETTLSELGDWSDMTQVMTSASLELVNGKMVVTLTNPYQYQGGNLLIGFKQTVASGDPQVYSQAYWYGVSATGASIGGHGAGYSLAQRNFLPKMTIEYVPGVAPACPNPKYLAVSNVTDNSAVASWKAVEGATWEYALVAGEAEPTLFSQTTESEITLTDLLDATDYVFYLRRACGENVYSDALSVGFTTEAFEATLPFAENFEGANHWKFINGTQTNAWYITDNLFVSNDGGVSNAYTNSVSSATFATILINFEENGTYTFSYDWKANGEEFEGELVDYMRVALVPGDAVLTAGVQALPAGYIALDNGGLSLATNWQHHVSDDVEVTPGLWKFVVAWFNDDAEGDQTPGAIDNISINHKAYPTDIESGAGIESQALKFIFNDQVYILLNGEVYNVTGQKVELK